MMHLVLLGIGRWGTKIAATLDRMGVKITAIGSEFGGVAPLWKESVSAVKYDGAIIATPPTMHAVQAVFCLEAGLPVFIEKPLCLSAETAKWIAEAAEAAKLPVLVDHIHLFSNAYGALVARINAEVLSADSIGGGPGPLREDCTSLWDYAPHDLALGYDLNLIHGDPIYERVQPDTGLLGENHLIKFDTRFRAYCGNAMAIKTRQLQVNLANSDRFVLNALNPSPLRYNGDVISIDPMPPLESALRVFIDAIGGKTDPRLGTDLGVRVVELIESLCA